MERHRLGIRLLYGEALQQQLEDHFSTFAYPRRKSRSIRAVVRRQLTLGGVNQHLIDFGFTREKSYEAVTDSSNASKVLGAVLNGAVPKLNSLKPDLILFSINYKNGAVESRRSLYDRLSHLYAKGSSYSFISEWISTTNGEYKLLAKKSFDPKFLDEVTELAQRVVPKE